MTFTVHIDTAQNKISATEQPEDRRLKMVELVRAWQAGEYPMDAILSIGPQDDPGFQVRVMDVRKIWIEG